MASALQRDMVLFWNKKINCFLYHAWPIPPGIHQRQGLHVGPVGCSPPSASFITLMGCYLQAALSGSPQPRSTPFSAHSFHIHPDTQADLTHNQAGRECSRRRGSDQPWQDSSCSDRRDRKAHTSHSCSGPGSLWKKRGNLPRSHTFTHCSSLWAHPQQYWDRWGDTQYPSCPAPTN